MIFSPRRRKIFSGLACGIPCELLGPGDHLDRREAVAPLSDDADDGGPRVAGPAELSDTGFGARARDGGEQASRGLRIEQQRIIRMRPDAVEVVNGAAQPDVLRL